MSCRCFTISTSKSAGRLLAMVPITSSARSPFPPGWADASRTERANVGKCTRIFVGMGGRRLVFFKFVAECCARRIKHDSNIFRLNRDQALENIPKRNGNIGRIRQSRQPCGNRGKKRP